MNKASRTYPAVFGQTCLWVTTLLFLIGCTGHLLPPVIENNDPVAGEGFVIVTVAPGDTLASLAQTHLNDPRKGWWIAAYNDIAALPVAQRVVIPLAPVTLGGLRADGYQTVPILLYPQVAREAKNSPITTAKLFEQQLDYLRANGYTTITLAELDAFLSFQDHIPPRAVVITFDTSQAWVYEIAYPLLKNRNMNAAVFVTTAEIDRPGNLSWTQLADLAGGGFDIGTSGRTAQDQLRLKAGEKTETYLKRLELEIAGAKSDIQKHTATECRYFAYPSGEASDALTAILKKNGFRAAFTRKRGSNPFFWDPFQLRRVVISGQADMTRFKHSLNVFRSAELQ